MLAYVSDLLFLLVLTSDLLFFLFSFFNYYLHSFIHSFLHLPLILPHHDSNQARCPRGQQEQALLLLRGMWELSHRYLPDPPCRPHLRLPQIPSEGDTPDPYAYHPYLHHPCATLFRTHLLLGEPADPTGMLIPRDSRLTFGRSTPRSINRCIHRPTAGGL